MWLARAGNSVLQIKGEAVASYILLPVLLRSIAASFSNHNAKFQLVVDFANAFRQVNRGALLDVCGRARKRKPRRHNSTHYLHYATRTQ